MVAASPGVPKCRVVGLPENLEGHNTRAHNYAADAEEQSDNNPVVAMGGSPGALSFAESTSLPTIPIGRNTAR